MRLCPPGGLDLMENFVERSRFRTPVGATG
jgi:hypothetical protein